MRKYSTKYQQRGSATSVDFMLAFPIFAIIMLFIIQMALMLHAYTVVHYSAYKAARSARVQMLDGDHAFRGLEFPEFFGKALDALSIAKVIEGQLLGDISFLNANAERHVKAAAMNQLVAISPARPKFLTEATGDSWNESAFRQYVEAASANSGHTDRVDPLVRKARYAFSEANTEVDIKFFDLGLGFNLESIKKAEDLVRLKNALKGIPPHSLVDLPVTVTVKYRYELQIPVGQVIFDDKEGRKYGRWMEATVTLM